MPVLSPAHHKLIEKCIRELTKFPNSAEERESRMNQGEVVRNILAKDKLRDMTEIEFGELISNLWASALWGNKDYLVQNILDDNGIDTIRTQFHTLLYGPDSFQKRFDAFIYKIKGLGPASLTEILCLYNPKRFSMWNDKTRKALRYLKFDSLPVAKYQISGKEYERINQVFMSIGKKLADLEWGSDDMLSVDFFLYDIWLSKKEGKPAIEQKEIQVSYDFDHDEVRDFIKDIGIQLGFETDTEKMIARGAQVDVVWTARIANLGVVTYVFEVHRKGSVDSLILNLQKALNNPTVQRIIAVSDQERLDQIKDEVKSLPEILRKNLSYWEVSDAISTREKLSEAIQSINKLELVKSRFEE